MLLLAFLLQHFLGKVVHRRHLQLQFLLRFVEGRLPPLQCVEVVVLDENGVLDSFDGLAF